MTKQNLAEITRKDFPMFSNKEFIDKRYIYLDHAATSQKPKVVIDALKEYYFEYNANVHRGAHQLSALATEAFEEAREIASKFINSSYSKEIIFTRNATEAINLVARSWGDANIKKGDEIILTLMEHHSNIVPWQLLAERKGCLIKYINISENGEIDLEDLQKKINKRTRLISVVHISNTLGCCNRIEEIAKISHDAGALCLIDACQSLAHQKIDVQKLNIDFLAGSSHKVCGPTGVGFLWGKKEILESMPPFLGGGEMIENVSLINSTWADLPHKFEAGTPPIGEAIAMGKALTYLDQIGLENIQRWEHKLTTYLINGLESIKDMKVLGPKPTPNNRRGALATFSIKNIHSNDISELLDGNGIFIRSGHHCCQPLHKFYNLNSTARASLSFTSTFHEVDILIEELLSAIHFLKKHN